MKIRVLSDLHLEFADWAPAQVDADVVVLAGDINIKSRGVDWALKHFEGTPVVYVPGNHEYYKSSLGAELRRMKSRAQGSNVHVLDNESIVIKGVRFIGTTLWTDYRLTGNQPLAELEALVISDFTAIRTENHSKLKPWDLARLHLAARAFLERALQEQHGGPTVVVTHHAPSELSISPHYAQAKGHLNASYASRLDGLMGEPVNLWIHGHMHDGCDYELYGTRVVCNPRGYSNGMTQGIGSVDQLNVAFDEKLLIEV